MAIQEIYDAVLEFNQSGMPDLVQKEIEAGSEVSAILSNGLVAAMDEVGRKFSAGDLFVPEMMAAAQAMKSGLEVLRPLLADTDTKPRGTVVIGTVKGDLHDIGKNLVSMMMGGAGFTVYDLGVDVSDDLFLSEIENRKADIAALSALLTTTMPAMEQCVARIKGSGLKVKTMVGGAPVNDQFAQKVGADGYAQNAPEAVALARRLIEA